jgi:membrane associated rhomboid family serine protease
VASGSPDLFVVCKHCGAEVSPYITECPYCGNRLQKRAPKINKDGGIVAKPPRRQLTSSLPRLRHGEIPGIRADAHPYATILLVALGFIGTLLWRSGAVDYYNMAAYGKLDPRWWHAFTAPFIYDNTGYAIFALAAVAIFGTLIEHRHGPVIVLALALLGGVAGTAISLVVSDPSIFSAIDGGNGIALALLTAWAIPDLIELISKGDYSGDLIGTGVLALVVALMPLVAPEASWLTDAIGVAAGILIGYPVARLHPV